MPKGRGSKGKKDDEERPAETEARAIDVKIKGAEDGGAMLQGNLELLKKMQEEKWKKFEWVDAEVIPVLRPGIDSRRWLTQIRLRLRNHGTHMRTT